MKDNVSAALGIDFDEEEIVVETKDIVPIKEEKKEVIPVIMEQPSSSTEDLDKDTEFARKKIRSVVDVGEEAFQSIIEVAQETNEPRAYEVVAILMKSITDSARTLMEIHEKKKNVLKDLSGRNTDNLRQTISVDKAVFVGTTTQLLDQIKKEKEE